MKAGFVAFLLIISHTMAAVPMEFKMNRAPLKIERAPAPVSSPDIDFCPLCIQFAGEFINELLNIVLNAVVAGGCGELCELLAERTNSKVAGEVCEILCAIVGIREFIAIVEKADLDPIYYCELLNQCPIFDGGDAKITELIVFPVPVVRGNLFQINMTYVSVNGTGTGEIALGVDAADGLPLGDSELVEPQGPGKYRVWWTANASPDPDCDPTQGPCEMWIPGNYTVHTAVCNGQCGSDHPHSQIYDIATTTFTLVEQN